jgi:hypothetical protein
MPTAKLKTKLLGTLSYDKQLDWWCGTYQFGKGHKVEIHINNIEGLEKILRTIEYKLNRICKDEETLREFAAKKLLKLANEWNEGEKVTKEDFVSRMRLEAVEFYNDLSSGLYYNDGDLFWGHTITIDIDKNGKCTRAEFQG